MPPTPIANRTVRVRRTDHPFIGDLYEKMGGKVTFSRLRRGEVGPITRPSMSDTLDPDLITVVGPTELVAKTAKELGHGSSHSLMRDRSYLDFRRITVSDPKVAGRTKFGSLDLAQKYSATVSRVRRGDIDLIGEPGLVLQQGDRVRVVAPTSKMVQITKFFGDSARGLSDINPIAMGLGMALGIFIGHIAIPGWQLKA